MAHSLNILGNAYEGLGKYEIAINYYQNHWNITQQIGDLNEQARCLNNLGNAYNSLGEYQRAIDFLQQSLDIKRQIGDKRGEATSWFNLAITRKNLQEYLEAKTAYENAQKLYQAMGLEKKVEECDQAIQDLNSDLDLGSKTTFFSRVWRMLFIFLFIYSNRNNF